MMNTMAEFVNENILGSVRIAFVAEQIFLPTTHGRMLFGRTQSSGPFVPIIFWLQVAVFWDGCCKFIRSHDRQPDFFFDQSIKNILTMTNHIIDQERGFFQGVSGTPKFRPVAKL